MVFEPEPLPVELADALDRARLRLGRLASSVTYFATVGSTNDIAAGLAASGDREGAVVIADAQSAGRGRRGHTWFSPPGSGLYVSVVLAPSRVGSAAERATALLTLTAGVALAEGVERASGLAPIIKWPNDLFVGHRKLGGILAEGVAAPSPGGLRSVVLGYGLNMRGTIYPKELDGYVTSLESELGRPSDSTLVCVETLVALATRYDDLLAARFDVILDAWRVRAPGSRGARVSFERSGGQQSGVTAGIDDDGALLVRVGERIERVISGQVHWHPYASCD